MVGGIADFVVSLGSDGTVRSQGTVEDVLQRDSMLRTLAAGSAEENKTEDEVIVVEGEKNDGPAAGKLVVAEEISEGHVSWSACELHIREFSLGSMSGLKMNSQSSCI